MKRIGWSTVARWRESLYGYDVFISYTRKDDPQSAYPLSLRLLLTQGSQDPARKPMRCFMDLRDMPHDEELKRAIEEKIRVSRFVVFVAGPHAIDHPWMCFEAEMARKHARYQIVIDRGIDWPHAEGLLKTTIGDVLAIPSNMDAQIPMAEVAAIAETVGNRRLADDRRKIWQGVAATLLILLAGATWLWIEAKQQRGAAEAAGMVATTESEKAETRRKEATVAVSNRLYRSGVGPLALAGEAEALTKSLDVSTDEPARESMALLAHAIRVNPDHRPAAAVLMGQVLQRRWPVPFLTMPSLSGFGHDPKFAGSGKWIIRLAENTTPETLVVLDATTPDFKEVPLTMEEGEEIQCFTASLAAPLVMIGTRQKQVQIFNLETDVMKDVVELPAIPTAIVCSHDGSRVAIATQSEVRLEFYEGESVKEAIARVGPSAVIPFIDPGGEWLATGGGDPVRVWKCGPGTLNPVTLAKEVKGNALHIFGQPAMLAVGGDEGMYLFDLTTGQLVKEDTTFRVRSFARKANALLAWGRKHQEMPKMMGNLDALSLPNPPAFDMGAALYGQPVLKAFYNHAGVWTEALPAIHFPIPSLDLLGTITDMGKSSSSSEFMHVHAAGNKAYWAPQPTLASLGALDESFLSAQMPRSIVAVAAYPRSNLVLLADDAKAVLWTPGARRSAAPWLIHAPDCRATAFSRDGRKLAAVHRDGTLRIWDCQSGQEQSVLSLLAAENWDLAWTHGDASLMALADGRAVFKIAPDRKTTPVRHDLEGTWKFRPTLSQEGTVAVAITTKGELAAWDTVSGQWRLQPLAGYETALAVQSSADGRFVGVLLPGEEHARLRILSTVDGKPAGPDIALASGSESASWQLSPKGTYVFVDQGLYADVHRRADGHVVWSAKDHATDVADLYFAESESRFATHTLEQSDSAHNLQFWELPGGGPTSKPVHTSAYVASGHFTANGEFFVARTFSGWDAFDSASGARVRWAPEPNYLLLGKDTAESQKRVAAHLTPGGTLGVIPIGPWLAVTPILPDFTDWNPEEATRLAHLAESLAGRVSTDQGGIANLSPDESMQLQNQLTDVLFKTREANQPLTWTQQLVRWALEDSSRTRLSPWLDLPALTWAEQAVDHADDSILQFIRVLDVHSNALNAAMPSPVAQADPFARLEQLAYRDPAKALEMLPTVASDPKWLDSPVNRGFRGYLRALAGQKAEGAADLAFAMENAPKDFVVYLWSARIAFVSGDYQKALNIFLSSAPLRNPPEPPPAGVAVCHWKLGNHDKALASYQRLVELDPKQDSDEAIQGMQIPQPIRTTLLEIRQSFHKSHAGTQK